MVLQYHWYGILMFVPTMVRTYYVRTRLPKVDACVPRYGIQLHGTRVRTLVPGTTNPWYLRTYYNVMSQLYVRTRVLQGTVTPLAQDVALRGVMQALVRIQAY
jgi:hypothetical protein